MNALFQAVINGDFNSVVAQLRNTWYGATDSNGLTGLHYAALYGQPEIGQLFIDQGLFVNRTTYDGHQPLHLAAQAQQSNMVDMLMSNGAAIRAVDYEGNTPLHYAVQNNPSPKFVQQLLDYGPELSDKNNNGQTALDVVQSIDNSELVVLFAQNNVYSNDLPPLLEAVVEGDLALAEALIDTSWYGQTDNVGLTGLHYAAITNQPDMAQLFIDRGMFINRTTFDGKQPLHLAAMAGQSDMIDFIMDEGGAILAVDFLGNTPLHYAVRFESEPSIAQQLVDFGAPINGKNNKGQTPLSFIDANEGELFITLLENGATSPNLPPLIAQSILGDVDAVADLIGSTWVGATDNEGNTGLHYAAQYNHPEVVQLFVDEGLFVNQTNFDGRQPLHVAAEYQQADAFESLMNNGAAIRAVDFEGNTPLHLAASGEDNADFTQFVMSFGADVDARNNLGQTPEDVATLAGNFDVVDALNGTLMPTPPLLVTDVFAMNANAIQGLDNDNNQNQQGASNASADASSNMGWSMSDPSQGWNDFDPVNSDWSL